MKKIVCALLIILAFVFVLTACGQTDETPGDVTTTADPGVIPAPNDSFTVVIGNIYSDYAPTADATEYLKAALEAVYKVEVVLTDDRKIEPNDSAYTVLVGRTEYDERGALPTDLKLNDYAYRITEPRLIAIDAGSPDALIAGVKHFCSEILGYTDGQAGEARGLKLGQEYVHRAEYPAEKVKVNGIDVEKFKIAIRYDRYMSDAQRLAQKLGEHNGCRVPIVPFGDTAEDEAAVIYLGCLDRFGLRLNTAYNGFRVRVSSKTDSYFAAVAGSTNELYDKAFDRFFDGIKSADMSNGGVSVILPNKTIFDHKYEFTAGVAGPWTLDASITGEEPIGEGLNYEELHYYDQAGSPHIANVLYVDTDIYTMSLGMPKSGSTYQTVTGQMQTAINAGLDVVAAVNGDRWNGQAQLRGLTIQDGKVITRGTHNGPYFARTKSGELKFGYNGHSDENTDLQMAIGGDYLLVSKGVPQHYSDFKTNDHLYTSHPRTMIGLTDDGILILVTIDGRQSHSKGATMENAADLMASLGCYMAVSLDGGGSSTMAVKTADGYELKNSPSDANGPRTVRNSLLIVKK